MEPGFELETAKRNLPKIDNIQNVDWKRGEDHALAGRLRLNENMSLMASSPSPLPELTVSDRAVEVKQSQGRLAITYEVTPAERLKRASELSSKSTNNFGAIDTNNDNFLSTDELIDAGGFNRYLARHAGVLSKNDGREGDGKLSWRDLSTLRDVTAGSDMEIRRRALASTMSTTSGYIGLGSLALTGAAELGCAMRGVPMNGKLRLAGYALTLGAFAYGYYQQQDHLFSLKEQIAQDADLNRYCKSGTFNIDGDHFRLRLKLK
ncbi:MAG: hypothetical protein K2W95_32095 [Candidatus Obscuribacterales bacterium]|nr:hypothetical protein [Candidatus Obscuribacterales bacterium]